MHPIEILWKIAIKPLKRKAEEWEAEKTKILENPIGDSSSTTNRESVSVSIQAASDAISKHAAEKKLAVKLISTSCEHSTVVVRGSSFAALRIVISTMTTSKTGIISLNQ